MFLWRAEALSDAAIMQRSAHNGFVEINITVPDFQVEATFRIGANPGFIMNCGPLAVEIGKGH
jgi:hypothetical protein